MRFTILASTAFAASVLGRVPLDDAQSFVLALTNVKSYSNNLAGSCQASALCTDFVALITPCFAGSTVLATQNACACTAATVTAFSSCADCLSADPCYAPSGGAPRNSPQLLALLFGIDCGVAGFPSAAAVTVPTGQTSPVGTCSAAVVIAPTPSTSVAPPTTAPAPATTTPVVTPVPTTPATSAAAPVTVAPSASASTAGAGSGSSASAGSGSSAAASSTGVAGNGTSGTNTTSVPAVATPSTTLKSSASSLHQAGFAAFVVAVVAASL